MAYNRYQYETSPRKLKPEYETVQKRYPKKSTARKPEKKVTTKTKKVSKARIISYVAIGFVTLFVISYRYAIIDKTYSNLKGLENDLGVIKKETAQLEANIESSLNLTTIKEEAESKLGMKKMNPEQIIYVTLPKTDYVETSSEEINNEKNNSNWFINIINKLVDILM